MAGIDILLDQSGDIDLTNNTMTLVDSVEVLARQKVLIELSTFRGEWVFNVTGLGIPYLANDNNAIQLLGAGERNKTLLDLEVRKAINEKEEILSITSFSSTLDKQSRQYSVTFTAITEQGEITLSDEIEI